MIPREIVEMSLVQLKADGNISGIVKPRSDFVEKIKGNFKKLLNNARENGLSPLSGNKQKPVDLLPQKTHADKENIKPFKIKFVKKFAKTDSKFTIQKIKK